MKIAVAIATTGRPDVVQGALADLAHQGRPADRIILSATGPEDTGPVPPGVEVLTGPRGLTRQRNAVLAALDDADVVLFLDDDFVMAPDYLARLDALLGAHSAVGIVTGNVLADGIGTAGLNMGQAHQILERAMTTPRDASLVEVNNAYGCNMAFRCAPIRAHGLRFDERLPLYGWLEDVDFSRRAARYGRCVQARDLLGVHLGTKGGRTSGRRLGYSQVANPVYLAAARTMRRGHALRMIARNLAANIARSPWPEPWVDRRGRLGGNLAAFGDLLRGRLHPERVLTLESGSHGQP
ncbi:glycosyltransferase family 2 protein [Oceaniglobus trochenteri]|uniref:glycosyltransferase family 2 protein n=1 Tax=Oceaniglobus trochenteri TaxID=2763260 RepID=UPI001D001371|nr:glycosyltransferase [Oceaniglobus trochenteri]